MLPMQITPAWLKLHEVQCWPYLHINCSQSVHVHAERAWAAITTAGDVASTPSLVEHPMQCFRVLTGLCPLRRHKCRWPTIHPISKIALTWSLITMAVDATYTAFLVPIGIAFHFKAEHFSWYNAIDIAAGKAFHTGLQPSWFRPPQHSCGRQSAMTRHYTMPKIVPRLIAFARPCLS